jgi:hypothetical protein
MSHVIPEQGLHVASCFVNSIFFVISVYHSAFALRNPIRVPILKYDPPRYTILSFRAGITIVLTAITFGEFVYQLSNGIYPDQPKTLFYTDQVLTFLAWASNVLVTVLIAKNGAWVYFKVVDHFLAISSWIFLFAIEALRFDQYVVVGITSSTEQFTSTLILATSLLYFGTFMAFFTVDRLRKWGVCLSKYQQLDGEDIAQDARESSSISATVVEERTHIVTVHSEAEAGLSWISDQEFFLSFSWSYLP